MGNLAIRGDSRLRPGMYSIHGLAADRPWRDNYAAPATYVQLALEVGNCYLP